MWLENLKPVANAMHAEDSELQGIVWDVHRHSSFISRYQCLPGLQHLQHRVHLHAAVEGLERSCSHVDEIVFIK